MLEAVEYAYQVEGGGLAGLPLHSSKGEPAVVPDRPPLRYRTEAKHGRMIAAVSGPSLQAVPKRQLGWPAAHVGAHVEANRVVSYKQAVGMSNLRCGMWRLSMLHPAYEVPLTGRWPLQNPFLDLWPCM